MIYYTTSLRNIFWVRGSVFPKSTLVATPCAAIAALLRFAINLGFLDIIEAHDSIMTQTQAWAGFSVLVGFLIIFRSSQAYSRFWDGCTCVHHMRADWFDAASALIAFTDGSKAPEEEVAKFNHTLVRLISMMHNCALMDLEEMNNKWGTTSDVKADTYDLLDPMGLDDVTLASLRESKCRVMLIFQWVQLLIVRNMNSGVLCVPPPILSRCYQEFAAGMVAFHECIKISDTPFPFPYAQNCELLLCLHWILIPAVVSQWVTEPFWAFIFVFMQVFVLWSLNYLAMEIENPFGTDDNCIDGRHMQDEMNSHLMLLLSPQARIFPTISKRAVFSVVPSDDLDWKAESTTFKQVYTKHRKALNRCASRAFLANLPPSERDEQSEAARSGISSRQVSGGSEHGRSASVETVRSLPGDEGLGSGCILRHEAEARGDVPFRAGTRLPPALGEGCSFAIHIAEGKDDGRYKVGKVHDQPPPAFDAGQFGAGRWETLPAAQRSSPPPRRSPEATSPCSEGEGSRSRGRGRPRQRSGHRRL